jgi:hypothetical protein
MGKRLCRHGTLAGLVKNPYPMVSARQEARWQRAPRRDILLSSAKIMVGGAAKLAAQFPLFTLH